jgi:hypothetical protein
MLFLSKRAEAVNQKKTKMKRAKVKYRKEKKNGIELGGIRNWAVSGHFLFCL